MYYQSGYSDIIGTLAEASVNEAVQQVKALPDYPAKGEVRIKGWVTSDCTAQPVFSG